MRQKVVAPVRYYGRIFHPILLNVVIGVGLPFVFLTVMQGAEILRCMAEQRFEIGRISTWQRFFLLVSLAVFSLHAWYFNRVLLYIKYEDSPEVLSRRAIVARNMVPRMTGLFPGAAVFTSLLAQNQSTNIKGSAQGVLSHDFLAPAVAYMLYPDLMQRFCFLRFETLDRAKALEMAWEQAWLDEMKSDALAGAFQNLWKSTNRMPSLFLSGTMVESGDRVVISNLDVKKFSRTEDAYKGLSADVPVSTAAHLSARFTYISPAGLFTNGTHVVDGGYFENSGAATVHDLVEQMDFGSEDECELFFIVITSQENAAKPGRILHEVIAPIRTLLNTRTARAAYSVGLLRGDWENDPILFTLDLRNSDLALGWQLSNAARDAMDWQLQSKTNGANLQKIRELVKRE